MAAHLSEVYCGNAWLTIKHFYREVKKVEERERERGNEPIVYDVFCFVEHLFIPVEIIVSQGYCESRDILFMIHVQNQ